MAATAVAALVANPRDWCDIKMVGCFRAAHSSIFLPLPPFLGLVRGLEQATRRLSCAKLVMKRGFQVSDQER